MRTVSFSDDGVRKLLNDEFICFRLNTRGDPTAGESFSHAPRDPAGPCLRGNGRQNVQILFLTPAAEIFHVLTGFVGPEDLKAELEWALAVSGEINEHGDDRKTALRDAHVAFLRKAGFSDAEIERPADGFPEIFAGATPRLPLGDDGSLSLGRAMESLERNQALADHRFAIEHPLLSMSHFEPEKLVGSGKSFFGSASFGNAQGDSSRRARGLSGR